MKKKANILFTATFSTSFIQSDLAILKNNYVVTEVFTSEIKTFFSYLSAIRSNDISFSWFASIYSSILIFLTKLFGKKSILILGGVDVAKIPELNYGIWNSWWKSIIVRYGIKNADIVLAVDPSIKMDAITLANYDGLNITVLPTGHNDTYWIPGDSPKQKLVLTVATCADYTRYKIKGIDFLYNVARALPEIKFLLIGVNNSIIEQFAPPSNIEIYDFIPHDKLLQFYQKAKVYFQPSMREALGSTICEAMLCECYPIGTNVGGIPTVIGDSGSIIPYGNVLAAVEEIREGMLVEHSHYARKRIMDHFSLHQRESELIEIIAKLYDK